MILYRIVNENNIFLRDDFSANENETAIETPIPTELFVIPKICPMWDSENSIWVQNLTDTELEALKPKAVEVITESDRISALETALFELMGVTV